MTLIEDRQRVRTHLQVNMVVEAGAGTGKTTLLIERLCLALLAQGILAPRLVALTFTEKAAAEIKTRLLLKLQKIVQAVEQQKPEPVLELLKEYWRSYPVKRDYLFVSLDKPHEPLKVSGVEIMLRRVGKEAGIQVHPHTLRHSFASHMIEQGVPITYVQSMLGHRCLESTQVYIHISNKTIMGIKSPLDHPQKKKRGRKPKKKDGDSDE